MISVNDPSLSPSSEPPSSNSHGRVGHETSDVNPLYVGLFGLGLAMMIALVLLALGRIFWRFEAAAERADPPQSPLAGEQTPPLPRLQDQPAVELARLRREEDQRLTSYGWIDRKQRVVRVPIDRAIEILAERGLPEPEGPPQPPPKEQERRP